MVGEQTNKGVIYTAVLGGSDRLRPPVYECPQSSACRWVRFTDQTVERDYQGWENHLVPSGQLPHLESRRYKLQPQKFFPDAPWSLWMDATHQWREDPVPMLSAIVSQVEMATFGHLYTGDEEYVTLCSRFPALQATLTRQRAVYERAGWSYTSKLRVGTIVLRKHTSSQAEFDDAWVHETLEYGGRDQIPLTYLLWQYRRTCGDFPGHPFFHPWFRYTHHKGDRGSCYPEFWGPFSRKEKRDFRKTLPIAQQRNWLEKHLEAYLARHHGRGDEHQYEYYRCIGCRSIISWKQIGRGGCACQLTNKLVPANVRWWELAQLLLTPWRWH